MASTSKCSFCGGTVRSDERTCPQCGGQNQNYVPDPPRKILQPKTIEELKEYCAERGMPLLRMRFFIGEDFREARAFGIYKAGENRFVVYKNKSDGSRAVRYDGPDEAYAVRELFEKLLSECHNRGIYPDGGGPGTSGGGTTRTTRTVRKYKNPILNWMHSHKILTFLLALLLLYTGGGAIQYIHTQRVIRQEREAFYRNPKTYDSRKIGDQYYTYNVHTGEITVSAASNTHLNDGYYQPEERTYLSQYGYYRTVSYWDGLTDGEKASVLDTAVYYRDGSRWYAYIEEEKDWKEASAPVYHGAETYLGAFWQDAWGVPDYSTFPIKEGYYRSTDAVYYRFRMTFAGLAHDWYSYSAEADDWAECACPLKLGVPADQLEYLKDLKGSDQLLENVLPFNQSTYYALKHEKDGYYRQEDTVYYRDNKSYLPGILSGNVIGPWYSYDREKELWQSAEEPDLNAARIKYLGNYYQREWQETWAFTSFKESALWADLHDVNGYYEQNHTVYYHYKSKWYSYDSDSSSWISASSPARDQTADTWLGETYQTDWESDWDATDFKTSAVWAGIRAEEIRIEREAQEAARRAERDRDSYSSDYDDWDAGDTDWDSDW